MSHLDQKLGGSRHRRLAHHALPVHEVDVSATEQQHGPAKDDGWWSTVVASHDWLWEAMLSDDRWSRIPWSRILDAFGHPSLPGQRPENDATQAN